MLPKRGLATVFLLLVFAAARQTGAWTVERSVSSPANPAILTWEFFQSETGESWDSVAITLRIKPGLPVSARVLAWPQSGPWAGTRPRMDVDSDGLRVKAWRGSRDAGEAGMPASIVTLSLQFPSAQSLDFTEVEAGLSLQGFAAQATLARLPPEKIFREEKTSLRDVAGRYRAAPEDAGQRAAAVWHAPAILVTSPP